MPPSPTVTATLRAFVRSVVGGLASPVPAADGLAAVELAEAAAVAARERRTVDMAWLRSRPAPDP